MAINFSNVGSNPIRDQSRADALAPSTDDKVKEQSAEAEQRSDVKLSDSALKLKALAENIAHQDAVDADRVEQIRRAISEGEYHVDPVRLAQKFVEFEGQL
jgi:negative regulator of flagellin synthesis FlgM